MSARAAWRLQSLGFSHVFRYTGGKADWMANGLPRAGKSASVPQVGELVQTDVPTCNLATSIGDVQKLLEETGWRICVVVNEEKVVLGLLWGEALEADPQTPVEEVMDCAPSTIRANVLPKDVGQYMRDIDGVLITTSD